MFINKSKPTRSLILIMSILAVITLFISKIYYKQFNDSIDPRIREARSLYEQYNQYAQNKDFESVFLLMDSIESIYSKYDHYKRSYENGVLYNNRAATFLTIALQSDSITDADSLMNLAETATNRSIEIYLHWLNEFNDLGPDEIKKLISEEFLEGLSNYNERQKERFLEKRTKELLEAQTETKRRLSVSYTNLGLICRHRREYEKAARHYKNAIELWDRNLTAENNLNILLGEPVKKRNFIQKMFPPEK